MSVLISGVLMNPAGVPVSGAEVTFSALTNGPSVLNGLRRRMPDRFTAVFLNFPVGEGASRCFLLVLDKCYRTASATV
ncbi:hypothetical protein PEC730217_47020 [Pectobacterium carotovorum subsp. carotovorum]|uniref:hypothetical protein n=1 Tax=Pectobacterium versatile TaxID=2488639 RepID=UPI002083D72B|nr:hypothetical protein PEC730217_47020 [Pectobacterium carotovorum subsp. carotovorum]